MPLHIVVTVKQVPDPDTPPTHFKIDEAAKKVISPPGVAPVINGYDANAIEEALRLREQHGGRVTAIGLGGDTARDALKRAIAMGADAAIHINDPSLVDGDAFMTAEALAAGIRKIGEVDLVLSGRQASDTDAGQVHLGVATLLDLPAISPVQKIEKVEEGAITVRRVLADGYQRVTVRLPALLGVSSEINEPRYPPLKGIMAAGRAQIPAWTAADIGVSSSERKVQIQRLYVEARESRAEIIEAATPAEAGALLADKLHEARLI